MSDKAEIIKVAAPPCICSLAKKQINNSFGSSVLNIRQSICCRGTRFRNVSLKVLLKVLLKRHLVTLRMNGGRSFVSCLWALHAMTALYTLQTDGRR
jgi:hypothetical protein